MNSGILLLPAIVGGGPAMRLMAADDRGQFPFSGFFEDRLMLEEHDELEREWGALFFNFFLV